MLKAVKNRIFNNCDIFDEQKYENYQHHKAHIRLFSECGLLTEGSKRTYLEYTIWDTWMLKPQRKVLCIIGHDGQWQL